MRRFLRVVLSLAAAAAICAAAIVAYSLREKRREVHLGAGRAEYLHFDLVDVRLSSLDPALDEQFRASPPRVVVTFGGQAVTTVAGIKELTLTRESPGVWTALWPVPWNAPVGDYLPALLGRDDLRERMHAAAFRIGRRKPLPLAPGMVVATLETVEPLAAMRPAGVDGTRKDWRGLLDWAQYLRADAFWALGGQSPGKDGELWDDANLALLPEVAKECRARGLKFGVYAEFSLTMSKTVKLPGYEYGVEVKDGRPFVTRAISLREHKRVDDVVARLKPFEDDPNVSFIGLDYIRNALGGCELVDDFVSEMPGVAVPPEWPKLTRDERMVWLARKKALRQDKAFVDAWQWWRARRVALIVREIKERLGGTKPLWAFTLTWSKGWNHGQDPVMMNDAGADLDALMFYQADKDQFAAMLKEWHAYIRRGDVQVVPGNIFDWGLHQKDPKGPGEFARRLRAAEAGVYADGPAQAVFFHDLDRLLWSKRLGPWGTRGWADAARGVADELKSRTEQEKSP
jgi:hypothetical protein